MEHLSAPISQNIWHLNTYSLDEFSCSRACVYGWAEKFDKDAGNADPISYLENRTPYPKMSPGEAVVLDLHCEKKVLLIRIFLKSRVGIPMEIRHGIPFLMRCPISIVPLYYTYLNGSQKSLGTLFHFCWIYFREWAKSFTIWNLRLNETRKTVQKPPITVFFNGIQNMFSKTWGKVLFNGDVYVVQNSFYTFSLRRLQYSATAFVLAEY